MKVSRKWLNRLVDIQDIPTADLASKLTNAGLEVESVEKMVTASNLVVGHVVEISDHPDSDHLHITKTDVGSEVLQIVCGAKNVAKDQKVIVALVGAKLKDLEIKPTTIRGVDSFGMLCSLKELGVPEHLILPQDKEGIKILPSDAPIGLNAVEYLGYDDEILDIKQTPNRSDFMAMSSIAYEVSALYNRKVLPQPVIQDIFAGQQSDFSVSVNSDGCHSFWAKVIKNVTIKPSPAWIQQALTSAGVGVHNNLVDISNLVMLEVGQPNHFYDYRFFNKPEITVEDNIQQQVQSLDGFSYDIVNGDVMICSDNQPIGIAGIKGLGNSMVVDDTRDIVIELAGFDSVSIRNTSKRLNLVSESSLRFTKPMDPLAKQKALGRILYLLKEYADVKDEDIYETVVVNPEFKYHNPTVSVSLSQVNGLLGTDFELNYVIEIFKRLNFLPMIDGELITCQIPSYRQDIAIKEDLIEEVIRIAGYDKIEAAYPQLPLTMGEYTDNQKMVRAIEQRLINLGCNQIESYTLVNKAAIHSALAVGDALEIMSPLSEARQFVRNSLTTSLLDALSYNLDYKNQNETYFEISEVYGQNGVHKTILGLVGSGQFQASLWQKTVVNCDYYTIKGLLEQVCEVLGINLSRLSFVENDLDVSHYHPYQSAKVLLDGKVLGLIGVLHPSLGIKSAMMGEVDLTLLFNAKKAKTKYTPLNKYPSVKRDLAVVVNHDVSVDLLLKVAKKAGKSELKSVTVFDVFEKDDKKSIGLSFVFESKDKTFNETEINEKMATIVGSLEKDAQALLR